MKKNNYTWRISAALELICNIAVLVCAAVLFNKSKAAAAVLFVSAAFMLAHRFAEKNRSGKMKKYFDRIAGEMPQQNNRIMFNIPDPIAGIRADGTLAWYNAPFSDAFLKNNFGKKLGEIFPDVHIKDIIADKGAHPVSVTFNSMEYCILATVVNDAEAEKAAVILYFENITDTNRLKLLAAELRPVVMSIKIDNYDETVADAGENEQLELAAAIDRLLINWATSIGGLTRKLEKDRYIAVFTNGAYKKISDERFSVLNEIRSIPVMSVTAPTLSIGVGLGSESIAECDGYARAALDMALGRGGDQAAVCDGGKFSYFGGTTKEVEKRTKVKARVMAQSLKEHIISAENVIVMGHKDADIDAVGAAIGIAGAAMHFERDTKILLNSEDSAVNSIVGVITKNHYHDGLFVGRGQIKDYITPDTLLVICDTHCPELTEMPELLEAVSHKILIDHHRRSESFIEDCDVVYHEPGASSTCEMVTEILMYTDGGLSLSTIDATALYAGIILDTKNFVFKTGSRTFEAAAYLRNAGVDTIKVKQFFRENASSHSLRNAIVATAQLDEKGIAVGKAYEEVPVAVVARAADDMLDIDGVKASFVISPEQDGSRISARSLGEVNVQLVMEALGGGGHALAAATQLEKTSVDEACDMLKKVIEETIS